MSTQKRGKNHFMGVNGGSTNCGPDDMASKGGISFIEEAQGSIIFPMLYDAKLYVLKPQVHTSSVA